MARIIVADDSPELIEMFSLLFQFKGYEIRTASSKKDLKNQLSFFIPDLILLDILFNGDDGRDVCKEMKEQNPTKNIPIVLISANPELLKNYGAYNADGVIEKPFDISTVEETINKYVDNNAEI